MRGGCVLVHQVFMIYLLWMRHQAFPRTLGSFPYLLFIACLPLPSTLSLGRLTDGPHLRGWDPTNLPSRC